MRNRIQFVVLFAVLVVLGGACSDDSGGAIDVGVGGATVVTQVPVTIAPLPAGDLPPAAGGERREVTEDPSVVNPTPSAVESYAPVDDDTVTLHFSMGVEDCYGLQKVLVDDQPDAVTVTLLVGGKPDAQVCIEIAELVQTTVDLPSPLGDRPLVDGATGEPIATD